jgi:predicted metal-dependent HD superfamily phosphohydrolase
VAGVDDHERVVRDAWRAVAGTDGATVETVDDVIARHREPHRRYHTVAHVAWVVRIVDELLDIEPVPDPDAVRVAAIFHDAVYDPRHADNELRSAELAAAATAKLGWQAERAAAVSRLILATAAHEAEGPDEAVLLDADLSILGTDRSTYEAYVRGVRAEYVHVDDQAWASGRASVLRRFLDRPHIYATTLLRDRAEPAARRNLTAELGALGH